MKFATKLSLIFLTISTVLGAVVSYVVYTQNLKSLEEIVVVGLEDKVFHTIDKIDRILYERYADIQAIAKDPIVSSPSSSREQLTKRLTDYRNIYKTYASLSFFNLDRIRIADTAGMYVGEKHALTKYWEDVLKGEISSASDVRIAEDLGVPIIYFASPVKDSSGKVFGVVVARIPSSNLHALAKEVVNSDGFGGKINVDLVDKNGLLLYSSHNKKGIMKDIVVDWESLGRSSAGEIAGSGIHRDLGGGEDHLFAFAQETGHLDFLGNRWTLVLNVPASVAFASVVDLRNKIMTVFLFMVFLSALITFFLSDLLTRPILDLSDVAENIARGDLTKRADVKSDDEVGQLSRSFNTMADSLLEAKMEVDLKVEKQTEEIMKQKEILEVRQRAILNILEDIEEEKHKTEQEKDRLDTILYSIGDGVFVIDKDYKITIFNQIASDISGFSAEEATGKRYDEILKFVFEKDKKVNDEFIKRVFETGEMSGLSNHTLIIRKDGSEVSVDDSAAPLRDTDGNIIGCVVVFRDVTKERLVDQMKTDFISVASHQLQTPLTGIRWLTEAFAKKEKLTERGKEYILGIQNTTKNLSALISLLLNASRIEGGSVSVTPKEFDLVAFINEEKREWMPLSIKNKVDLSFEDCPEEMIVFTDENILRNIFQSLISNAIEYTKEGGKVSVSLMRGKGTFTLIFKDTGIGIPKEDQPKIFSKFVRGSNAQAWKTNGTGLGLFTTKHSAGILGGKIWFESEENVGSTFYIELPIKAKAVEGAKKVV